MEEQIINKGMVNDTCSDVHILCKMGMQVPAAGLQNVMINAWLEDILVFSVL